MTAIRSALFHAALALAAIAGQARAQTPPAGTPDLRPEKEVSGQWLPGEVMVTLRQPDGKLLVGGTFDRVAGTVARSHLMRLNRDGSLDTAFAPQIGSATAVEIRALALGADGIYAGGLFESVGGVARFSIAKLHVDGSLDVGWASPFPATSANEVNAIVVSAEGVFVGGDLQQDDAYGLLRLDPVTGAVDGDWRAPTYFSPGSSSRGEVYALDAVGSDLIVGGQFGQIAGVAKTGAARLSRSAPVAVRAFDAGISGEVHALERAGNQLYIGGNFFRATGPGPGYLNRLDATSGALDAAWAPTPNGSVYALHRVLDMLYVGGSFVGVPTGGARLARYPTDGSGSIDGSWNPNADDTVNAIADSCHGELLVGGNYVAMSGATRNGLSSFAVPQIECLFTDGFDAR